MAKILFACDTLPENPFTRDRLPAIEKAGEGYDLSIVDLFPFPLVDGHKVRREKTYKKYFAEADLERISGAFFDMVYYVDPDIVIMANLDCISLFMSPNMLKDMRKSYFTVGIFGDDEYMLNRNAHWVGRFDKCVAYVKWCVDWYNTIVPGSCYWLPNACYFPEPDFDKLQKEKDIDLLFMGAPFGNRPEIIKEISQSLDINLAIYGDEKWGRIYGLKEHYRGRLPSDQIDETIQRSKLVLALMGNHINGAPHMNTKPWDAIRSGVLPVMSYWPNMDDYGFKKNDYAMGSTVGELVDIIDDLLKNPDKRQRMAKGMFDKTKKKFDYVDLYRKLFKKLEAECR